MENPAPSLSPTEWEVMKTLWEQGPMAARDVFAALPADAEGAPARGWAYKTVKTLLSRLVAKGAIDYEQIGNSYLYRAVVERDAMTQQEIGGVLDRLAGPGSVSGTVLSSVLAQFLGGADLSDSDLEKLQSILDRKRGRKASPTKKGRKR